MPNKYYPFDKRLEHRAAGLAALTAATTLATITERAEQRTSYLTKVSIESIVTNGAAGEGYTLVIEVSNDGFTTKDTAEILSLGATSARTGGAKTNVAGDSYELLWCTEVGGKKYKEARLRLIVSGTAPSIAFSAFSTIMPGA